MTDLKGSRTLLLLAIAIFVVNLLSSLYVHCNDLDTFLLIKTDPLGYYQYLPSWFCDHELLPSRYVVILENGQPLSIFSFGVAILQMPFFLMGHFFSGLLGYESDGFSVPYAIAQFVSTSFYLALSCFLLGRYLLSKFTMTIVAISILAIYLGTNLYYYSCFDTGMSHTYNFFLFALLIFSWYKVSIEKQGKYFLLLGLLFGLQVLVKPYNLLGVIWLIPFSKNRWEELWNILRDNLVFVLGSIIIFFCFLVSQMYYWNEVSGKWLLFSYGTKGEGFNWTSPELFRVLFSVQNGWLIYTPLMLFSLWGIVVAIKNNKEEAIKIGIILLLIYYIISSWWAWWFGGAYGHRAFIEYYAFLIIPLAYFIQDILERRNWLKYSVLFLICVFAYANLRMSYLYWAYPGPWDGDNWTWVHYNRVLNDVFFLNE